MKSQPLIYRFSAKLTITLLFCVASLSSESQTGYIIDGKITGVDSGVIVLKHTNKEGRLISDSCSIKNGSFRFTGDVNVYNSNGILYLNKQNGYLDNDSNATRLELDNSAIQLELQHNNFKQYQINGCASCDEYRNFIASVSDTGYDRLQKIIDYISTHPGSNISARLIWENREQLNPDTILSLFTNLTYIQRHSFFGGFVKSNIHSREEKAAQKIKRVPTFSFTDIKGQASSSDSLYAKSKYILIEFWGSWCKPCRQEHPAMKKMYERYHSQGFEILSVAFDNIVPWKNAIREDKVGNWIHVLSQHTRVDNDIDMIEYFHVHSYPTLIVIDNKGNVLARDPSLRKLKKIISGNED